MWIDLALVTSFQSIRKTSHIDRDGTRRQEKMSTRTVKAHLAPRHIEGCKRGDGLVLRQGIRPKHWDNKERANARNEARKEVSTLHAAKG